jgi:hypothetical protein
MSAPSAVQVTLTFAGAEGAGAPRDSRTPNMAWGERLYGQIANINDIDAATIINTVVTAAVNYGDLDQYVNQTVGIVARNQFVATVVAVVLRRYNENVAAQVQIPTDVDLQGSVASAYTKRDAAKGCCVVL